MGNNNAVENIFVEDSQNYEGHYGQCTDDEINYRKEMSDVLT